VGEVPDLGPGADDGSGVDVAGFVDEVVGHCQDCALFK
jgi:hypothetical protein